MNAAQHALTVRRLLSSSLAMAAWLAVGTPTVGCAGDPAPVGADATDTSADSESPDSFDDHTVSRFASTAEFVTFSDLGEQPIQAKFVMTQFQEVSGQVHYLDPHFYQMHDEWYWFRLLNGQSVAGLEVRPTEGLHFETIAEVYSAYSGVADLPYDLRWFDTRLASQHFYDEAIGRCNDTWSLCPRTMAVGSVVHLPANPNRAFPGEIWAVELEYVDNPTEAVVRRILARIEPTLPPEALNGNLRWLARTAPSQEALAKAIRAAAGPLKDRVLTYADLVTPGEVVTYNPGIRAGHVRRIRSGELSKTALDPNDIVILEEVPDDLPPVAGIITAVPQTPQAHFNLLAVARGTPNAYVAGVFDDASLATFEADGTPVVFQVTDETVRWQPMTPDEWTLWLQKSAAPPRVLVPADLTGVPHTMPLDGHTLSEMKGLVPIIGGKSAGMLALLSFPAVPAPYLPLSITVKGYAEFFETIRARVEPVLADVEFLSDRRVRYLALEGEEHFREAQSTDPDAIAWLERFKATTHKPALTSIVAAGGVQGLVLSEPVDPAFLAALTADLTTRFAGLSHSQGLRFRSSSTAEDVEGFNGAGVYTSETGFLYPDEQSSASDKKKTVERTLRKVWASFWSFGAFEERRAAGLSHLAGRMAVTVHPRFDDVMEVANGVFLLSLTRADGPPKITLTINVQAGALSVTNPPPGSGITPEVDRVTRAADVDAIERLAASSETDGHILSDAELGWLMETVAPIAEQWLDAKNSGLDPREQSLSVTLDFEFRKVAEGWPALAAGAPLPARIVIKQVRPLSRNGTISPMELGSVKVPRDILASALRVVRHTCSLGAMTVEATDVTTDSAATLLPFSVAPYPADVRVSFPSGTNPFGIAAGTTHVLNPTVATLAHPNTSAGHWELTAVAPEGLAWQSLSLVAGGAWSITDGSVTDAGELASCTVEDVALTPQAWLESLLAAE